MADHNQMYVIVDNNVDQIPGLEDPYVDVSNYETLAEFANLYEQPQKSKSDKTKPITCQLIREDTSWSKKTITAHEQFKNELKKTKRCLVILSMLVAVLLLVSLAAIALAAFTHWQNTTMKIPSAMLGQVDGLSGELH